MDEREFELVNIVGAQLAANQRQLSRQMKLSLGMTNMLLKRLVTKGYIRIQQLDQRKVRYILTPKGFAEKMQKTVKYTLKTIQSIGLIKKNLFSILQPLYAAGNRKFYILGESDLGVLIDNALKENHLTDCILVPIKDRSHASRDGIILICMEEIEGSAETHVARNNDNTLVQQQEINMLEALASYSNGEI